MSNYKKEDVRIVIGFDFGMKRIGIAVGQTVTQKARPLETIPAKNGEPNWAQLSKIIKKWHPDILIVGMPLNMDGSDQSISRHTRRFAQSLKEKFQIPIFEMDERLTTKSARENLFNKGGYKALQDGQVDQLAAQLILQNWFDETLKK